MTGDRIAMAVIAASLIALAVGFMLGLILGR